MKENTLVNLSKEFAVEKVIFYLTKYFVAEPV